MALHLTRRVTWLPRRPTSGTTGAALAVDIVRQALLMGLAALAYFGVRGLTQGAIGTALDNADRVIALERALHVAWEEALQNAILDTSWLVTAANWVYIYGHWPVVAGALGWLFVTHRDEYFTLRNAMFVSGAIGIVIFALFPTAPPRLAEMGLVDTVTERSSSYRALQPPGLLNKYAAMPSLHFGWNLLVGIMVWRVVANRVVRMAAVALPAAMAFAVVVTANHFVLDVAVGGMVALTGLWLAQYVDPVAGRVGEVLR